MIKGLLVTLIIIGLCIICLQLVIISRGGNKKVRTVKGSDSNQEVSGLLEFLEQADDAYILAHQLKEINKFSKYATNRVCDDVLNVMNATTPVIFGTKAYRERTWSIVSEDNLRFTVRKEITYKHIEVKKGIKVSIGDELKEYWRVLTTGNGYVVEDIMCA